MILKQVLGPVNTRLLDGSRLSPGAISLGSDSWRAGHQKRETSACSREWTYSRSQRAWKWWRNLRTWEQVIDSLCYIMSYKTGEGKELGPPRQRRKTFSFSQIATLLHNFIISRDHYFPLSLQKTSGRTFGCGWERNNDIVEKTQIHVIYRVQLYALHVSAFGEAHRILSCLSQVT